MKELKRKVKDFIRINVDLSTIEGDEHSILMQVWTDISVRLEKCESIEDVNNLRKELKRKIGIFKKFPEDFVNKAYLKMYRWTLKQLNGIYFPS